MIWKFYPKLSSNNVSGVLSADDSDERTAQGIGDTSQMEISNAFFRRVIQTKQRIFRVSASIFLADTPFPNYCRKHTDSQTPVPPILSDSNWVKSPGLSRPPDDRLTVSSSDSGVFQHIQCVEIPRMLCHLDCEVNILDNVDSKRESDTAERECCPGHQDSKMCHFEFAPCPLYGIESVHTNNQLMWWLGLG
ncbi:hypothetical protein T265_05608 [Opisthorchis viverrini]|uniref:Uncharacterized protein n=1 Tax=Opisthorchis viverrini TaxID=6198 RepID=A0A074ZNE7_OPIVI|nr:hypothetical protein T265_05608 [Opisthorchis viverrini]KER27282.1 hypothetical protein T265_05608 [Opisthorchis viverrini]